MAPNDYLGADDLASFIGAVQSTNPYGVAGQTLNAWQPNTSTWTGAEAGIGNFAKSFLGTLLGNYAQEQAAEQAAKVVSVLPQLNKDPMSVVAPEGVDSGPFALLRGSSYLKNQARQQATAQSLLERGIDISDPSLANLPIGERIARAMGKIKESEAEGTIKGQNKGYGLTDAESALNPDSPQYQQSKIVREEADAARAEIAKMPAVQKLQTTSTALAQIDKMKDLDTRSSDIPFATIFIGGLDGSVVKEGEYSRVAGSNPFLEKYRNLFESVLNGGSELGVDMKRQMYQEMMESQKSLLDEANRQSASRLATATKRGALAADVLPYNPQMAFGTMQDRTSTGITAGQAAQIAAAVKARYGDTPQAREEYRKQIQILQQQKSPSGVPIG